MREQPRIDRLAGGEPLEVVSDQRSSFELLFEVVDAQFVAGVGGMSPDAGQAVGLELDSHRTRVLAGWFPERNIPGVAVGQS
jgi:hypothetical protein